ncbi:MAG TPA: DUF4190 domain-containing protein [Thermoanaerobaculia bacterium]
MNDIPTPATPPTLGQPAESASSQAITALILGLAGFFFCQLLGPFAWYLGNQEVRAIREGRSPKAGESLATVGKICGIVATVLLILIPVVIIAMGGMAFLAALFGAAAD